MGVKKDGEALFCQLYCNYLQYLSRMLRVFMQSVNKKTIRKSHLQCQYAVVRCDDMSVVAQMDYFPDSEKSVMYRNGNKLFFLPMRSIDVMGSDKLMEELCIRAAC